MKNIKKAVCFLIALTLVLSLGACKDSSLQGTTNDEITTDASDNSATEATTGKATGEAGENITVLALNKEYISHYEWYEDFPEMLVKSEYTDVAADEATAQKYPELAKALAETSVMRKRAMEEEKDNLLADAVGEFMNDGELFETHISRLDIEVRRADSVAVSILEDYHSDSGRAFSGLNYDTESGKLLELSNVVKELSEIPSAVEKNIMSRIGEEPTGDSAVIEYFNNISWEDICWTLDYNGVTFWFNPGRIAPTNFGVQTATLTFSDYPELFNEKYSAIPEAYIVGLPTDAWSFTDITGDKRADGIFVTGYADEDIGEYTSLSIDTDAAHYEEALKAYEIDPYYVMTSDGSSYLYVFCLSSEGEYREAVLSVFSLEEGGVKRVGETRASLLYRGNNVFSLPTDPDRLLLSKLDDVTGNVFSVDKDGMPVKADVTE